MLLWLSNYAALYPCGVTGLLQMRHPHQIDQIHPMIVAANTNCSTPIKNCDPTHPFGPIHELSIVPIPGKKMFNSRRQSPGHPGTETTLARQGLHIVNLNFINPIDYFNTISSYWGFGVLGFWGDRKSVV